MCVSLGEQGVKGVRRLSMNGKGFCHISTQTYTAEFYLSIPNYPSMLFHQNLLTIFISVMKEYKIWYISLMRKSKISRSMVYLTLKKPWLEVHIIPMPAAR